ncbi:DUF4355 domain-containing protein [Staphylococcus saprophyticus]|uniref:capsid assembly scaffolding protein Gp46 family protein n=1 Tax=Staphylococcus saprophyticus TaxID=29385 RepID=UPI00157C82B1|nr:DUF4355 domain-containing protein [Staphylococcus saprophyticus]QKQ06004.1 DUF4355 domain-containing protein [Staphylococcus saprophyticus]
MDMNKFLKLNLQHFADDEGNEGETNNNNNDESVNDDDQTQDDKAYSQSEVDSAISKAVDKALTKQEKKYQQQIEDAKEQARKEAESYAKLTEKEKRDKELEKRENQLKERERELNLRHLKSDVEADLKENNLPTTFAESLILIEDNEKIKESIQSIKQDFDLAVKEQVKEATRQNTPSSGNDNRQSNSKAKSIFELANENRKI